MQEQLLGLKSLQENDDPTGSLVRLKKELRKFMKLTELTPEMVHRFVDKIIVEADGTVNIYYKFAPNALNSA
ncbi:DUF4368 domain-containing protein [Brevibacillus sp. HB1.3]|uniref:DUF4368 domain-containing protein n=1 Tax=Brevibacillus sp. HB1.3 TaxID=2738842 RepID=UPI001554EDA0|nr:DUF4368 domain-containing protein [Brevibacillus sp. HB1.3]NQF15765.1 DUF4368 domain-containing protein [Brevibacillus sp. HB1.3]